MKNILKILVFFIILYSAIGISSANPSPPANAYRGTMNPWTLPQNLKADIDKLENIGGSVMWVYPTKAYIADMRAGKPDYIADAIKYADTKNIRIIGLMSMTTYGTGTTSLIARENFLINTDAQIRFLQDLEYVLQRYPTIDGINMEEPHSWNGNLTDGGLKWRSFNNIYLVKAKNIVQKYHNIDTMNSFEWSFNAASNSDANLMKTGIDFKYINDNKVFNGFVIQNVAKTVTDYEKIITNWKQKMPNLVITSGAYLTSSGIIRQTCTDKTNWNSPSCWNPVVFKQIEWAHNNRVPVLVFVQMNLGRSQSLWPSETIPGATAGDKVKYIWSKPPTSSASIVVPPGMGGFSIKSEPQGAFIKLNGGNFGQTNRDGQGPDNPLIIRPPATYTLQLILEGYETRTETIDIIANQVVSRSYQLTPIKVSPTPIVTTPPAKPRDSLFSQIVSWLHVTPLTNQPKQPAEQSGFVSTLKGVMSWFGG